MVFSCGSGSLSDVGVRLYFFLPHSVLPYLRNENSRTFLLEKIRLVHTSEGERNFHIFYLMLAGTSDEQREVSRLNSLSWRCFSRADDECQSHLLYDSTAAGLIAWGKEQPGQGTADFRFSFRN